MLIPADGASADGTVADFAPLFAALSSVTGLRFDLRAGHSYAAVIEGICARQADIAWLGPLAYQQARERGCAELLGVEVVDGASTYYAGIFVDRRAKFRGVSDLRGRSLALGSMQSASSFAYPLALLHAAGLDPARDLRAIRLASSHAATLTGLRNGQVDAAGASFVSYERAVNQGVVGPQDLRVLARSAPIPNPPLAIHPALSASLKARLRTALAEVHRTPGIRKDMIRGYGGRIVDRYDVTVQDRVFSDAARAVASIDEAERSAILRKASEVQP
jgi:phosphonate transport system substrate-binding protein